MNLNSTSLMTFEDIKYFIGINFGWILLVFFLIVIYLFFLKNKMKGVTCEATETPIDNKPFEKIINVKAFSANQILDKLICSIFVKHKIGEKVGGEYWKTVYVKKTELTSSLDPTNNILDKTFNFVIPERFLTPPEDQSAYQISVEGIVTEIYVYAVIEVHTNKGYIKKRINL